MPRSSPIPSRWLFAVAFGGAFLSLASLGCRARTPVDAGPATVQIARLQSFDAAPDAPLPPAIARWLGAGASGLSADLVPPGLVVGGTPKPYFAPDAPRFAGFHVVESRAVPEPLARDLVAWARADTGAAPEDVSCMYPEFGLRIVHARGEAVNVLVSLACEKKRTIVVQGDARADANAASTIAASANAANSNPASANAASSNAGDEHLTSADRARFVLLARRAFGAGATEQRTIEESHTTIRTDP